MTPLWITLDDGQTITFEQMLVVKTIIEANPGWIWHKNDCGCCVTVHAGGDQHVTEGYIVNSDGEAFYETTEDHDHD